MTRFIFLNDTGIASNFETCVFIQNSRTLKLSLFQYQLVILNTIFINSTKEIFIIVAFLENATIGYSLESVCVCVCVCVCVFLHDNSKRNRSRNTKSEYIVVYENSSDEFEIQLILSIYLHLILIYKINECRHA